jgi:anti-sigma factor RsiW
MVRQLFLATASGLLVACGSSSTQVQCTAILVPAFKLSVRDAQTDSVITGRSTIILTLRGAKPDTFVDAPDPAQIGDVSGTYDLSASSPGYASWLDSSVAVAVSSDGCHPVTLDLQAKLQRIP